MKKGIAVAVASIASLAVGIGGTYYYMSSNPVTQTKVTNETKKVDKEKNEKITNLDVYSDIVQNNFNKYMTFFNCQDPSSNYLKSTKVNNNDIPNQLAYHMVAMSTYSNKGSISESDWNKEIEKLFGKDYKYDPTSFDAKEMCTSHIYNSSTKQYEYRETACGCATGPNASAKTYISKAEMNNDTLTIYVKALFPDNQATNSEGFTKYYSDSEKTKEVNLEFSVYDIEKSSAEPDSSYENIKKAGTYKITMKKYDDNNYYFVSSEPVQ